jgi:hypothetical protein
VKRHVGRNHCVAIKALTSRLWVLTLGAWITVILRAEPPVAFERAALVAPTTESCYKS